MSTDPADALDALVAGGREPGGAVAVVRDGAVEVHHPVGTRDGTSPWAPDTLVMAFSVAKPFAALAFLDAVADGRLRLEQPVASVWPEFAGVAEHALTYGHLLDEVLRRATDEPLAERFARLASTWREYVQPVATGHDRVLDRPVTWTLGFQVGEEDGPSSGWAGRAGARPGTTRVRATAPPT